MTGFDTYGDAGLSASDDARQEEWEREVGATFIDMRDGMRDKKGALHYALEEDNEGELLAGLLQLWANGAFKGILKAENLIADHVYRAAENKVEGDRL